MLPENLNGQSDGQGELPRSGRVHYIEELSDSRFVDKRFLVRVDYNDQHWDDQGRLINDRRFRASLPTINYILQRQGKVIILTHQGRPEPGKISEKHRLTNIADAISEKLGFKVPLLEYEEDGKFRLVTNDVRNHVRDMKRSDVCILGNSRFDTRDQSPDSDERVELATELASLADFFVLDGFPIVHRDETTVTEVARQLPSFGGFWLKQEIRNHELFTEKIEGPGRGTMVAIFAGIKPDKLKLIQIFSKLMRTGDTILLAGPLKDHLSEDLKEEIEARGIKLVLQVDSVDTKDVGTRTLGVFTKELNNAQLVFWNGPLGRFEEDEYAKGTVVVACKLREQVIANQTQHVFISGGETSFVVTRALDFREPEGFIISTGGGASTAFFAQSGQIPGIVAVSR